MCSEKAAYLLPPRVTDEQHLAALDACYGGKTSIKEAYNGNRAHLGKTLAFVCWTRGHTARNLTYANLVTTDIGASDASPSPNPCFLISIFTGYGKTNSGDDLLPLTCVRHKDVFQCALMPLCYQVYLHQCVIGTHINAMGQEQCGAGFPDLSLPGAPEMMRHYVS